MSSFAVREAKLRQAIADASSLAEQRRLTSELDALRREAADQVAIDRELELGAQIVRDTTTPVRVHDRHTAATDWLTDIEIPNGENYDKAMRVEAALWFKKLHTAVKSDRDEFAEQAQGMASRLAGQYGPKAAEAAQAFLSEVARLFRQADDRASENPPDHDQAGTAESEVTDYDPKTEQDPMWAEDYDGEDDTGSQIGSGIESEQPASPTARRRYPKGSARGGGRTAQRTSTCRYCGRHIVFEGGIWVDPEATGDDSMWRETCDANEDSFEAEHAPEEITATRKTAASEWYNAGYDKGEQFSREFGGDPYGAPDPLSGEWAGESIPEIFGSWDAATEEAMDAYEEGYWAAVAGEPRKASKSKRANEGKTCAECGDPIAQTDGDYHHDSGSKHDHKARVSSKRTAGVYCKTHQVWVGDENADTHSRDSCKKEQRATEKTKDARKHASEIVVFEDTNLAHYCAVDGCMNAGNNVVYGGGYYQQFFCDEHVPTEPKNSRKQAADDEATNEFAEEVAEELAGTSEEPVDNGDDGDVTSEDDDESDKEAKLTAFRKKVAESMPFGSPCPDEDCGLEEGHAGEHQDA